MIAVTDRVFLAWERLYPTIFGIVGFFAGFMFGPLVILEVHSRDWITENVFVAIFTMATVTAGFGLTIYTFILTTDNGFIGRAKRSIYYRSLLTYVLRATILSGLLALISAPLMVVNDVPEPYQFHAFYLGIWAGIAACTAAALYRAGHLFSIFARQHH